MEATEQWDHVGAAVLCSCMLIDDGAAADHCIEEGVGTKHFHDYNLGYVWDAIEELRREDKEPNEMAVYMKLGDKSIRSYQFNDIVEIVETGAFYRDYVVKLKEFYKMNELRKLSLSIKDELVGGTSDTVLAHINKITTELDMTEKGLTPAKKFIESAYEDITSNDPQSRGIPTEFHDLDDMIGGLKKKSLTIIAGRPGLGKSSIAINIADAIAIRHETPVALFSLEMTEDEIGTRLMCARAGINEERVREKSTLQMQDFENSRTVLREAKIFVDDSSRMTIQRIAARARKLKARHGLGVIIIDYFQLLSPAMDNGRSTRQQQLGEISRDLKRLAKSLDVSVLCLAQLNREHEKQERKPKKTDLRESGDLEQDADNIILLYQSEDMKQQDGVELIICKQRNGPTGEIMLKFTPYCTKFSNWTGGIVGGKQDEMAVSVEPAKKEGSDRVF